MPGLLALIGGGEFTAANESLDRRLLDRSGGSSVLVIPTADAFEHPDRLVEQAAAWFGRFGGTVSGLPLLTRSDAFAPSILEALHAATFVYIAGDSQLHLRAVLKDTPALETLRAAWERGTVVAASGPAATAISDPMLDSRGGGLTLGLGLISGLAFVPRADSLGADWLKRTRDLARGGTVAEAGAGGALVLDGGQWERIGPVAVHGELPIMPP